MGWTTRSSVATAPFDLAGQPLEDSTGPLQIPSTEVVAFQSPGDLRARWGSPADGVVQFTNSTGNSFSQVIFGPATSAGMSLVNQSGTWRLRNGNNSADVNFSAKDGAFSGALSGASLTIAGSASVGALSALAITGSSLSVTGSIGGATLSLTGGASVGGNLAVTGTTTHGGALSLPNTSVLTDTANGTVQLTSASGTFANVLLGAAGATTGIKLVPSNGILALQTGSGSNAVTLNTYQIGTTFCGVGGGALTFNGSGAAVTALAASIYTPNTSTLSFNITTTNVLTMTASSATFAASVLINSGYFGTGQCNFGNTTYNSQSVSYIGAGTGASGLIYLAASGTTNIPIQFVQPTGLAAGAAGFTFNGLVGLKNGTLIGDTTNGTLQVTTATGTFGTLLLGGTTNSTGVQLVGVNGGLQIYSGSGGNSIQVAAASFKATAGGYGSQNGGTAAVPLFIGNTSNTGAYFPTTTSFAISTNGVAALTIDTNQNSVFAGTLAATYVQSTGGQGQFSGNATTATFCNSASTYGVFVTSTALTLKTANIAAITIDASQNATFSGSINLKNGSTFTDASITTPVATQVVGPTFNTTAMMLGNTTNGVQFWYNGSNTLYITNAAGGTTVNINTGGVTSHGVFTVTNFTTLGYVVASGYGMGTASGATVQLTANNVAALVINSTQQATFSSTVTLGSQTTDPTGVNGMLYYDSTNGRFRAYVGGAWKTVQVA